LYRWLRASDFFREATMRFLRKWIRKRMYNYLINLFDYFGSCPFLDLNIYKNVQANSVARTH